MEYFIYILKANNVPFYVGQSVNPSKRKKRHIYDALTLGLNYPVHNKIRKILKEKISLDLEILESNLTETNIDEREQHWIADYRKNHKMYNVADGGMGFKGFTPEMLEKIRQRHFGRKCSPETRKRISDANKGKKFTKQHRKKLSIARRKRKTTDETRKKMSEATKGKINIKNYRLIDPYGKSYITTNGLSDFCRLHGLTPGNMCKVLNGERKHHKGWRIERV